MKRDRKNREQGNRKAGGRAGSQRIGVYMWEDTPSTIFVDKKLLPSTCISKDERLIVRVVSASSHPPPQKSSELMDGWIMKYFLFRSA